MEVLLGPPCLLVDEIGRLSILLAWGGVAGDLRRRWWRLSESWLVVDETSSTSIASAPSTALVSPSETA